MGAFPQLMVKRPHSGSEMETDCSMLIGADLALPALEELRDSVVGKSRT